MDHLGFDDAALSALSSTWPDGMGEVGFDDTCQDAKLTLPGTAVRGV
jgi:hypothetical protein